VEAVTPLVSIEGEEIVIRVKLSALEHGADYAWERTCGPEHRYFIEDPAAFAKEMVTELGRENEIGETIITAAFDKAAQDALENGGLGIGEKPKEEPIDGFMRMHFENCDYFTSRGTKSCTMDCCS
jgi:hypothetical protein